jgi:hypothetical protein
LGWKLCDEEYGIRGYPFGELSAIDIGINHALLDIRSKGVLVDVLWLRQANAKDRELCD